MNNKLKKYDLNENVVYLTIIFTEVEVDNGGYSRRGKFPSGTGHRH